MAGGTLPQAFAAGKPVNEMQKELAACEKKHCNVQTIQVRAISSRSTGWTFMGSGGSLQSIFLNEPIAVEGPTGQA